MLQHMVSRNMPPKNCVADFPEGIVLLCRVFQASCTFVATKLRFVLTKVTCRMLAHRSGWPLFRMAKEGPGNLTTNVSKYEESENQVHQGQNDTGGSTTV